MKRIAIITGATGGIGQAFVSALIQEDIDEIWTIGRNQEKLQKQCDMYGSTIVPLPLDLTNSDELQSIQERLNEEDYTVTYLINNAGLAQMKATKDFTVAEITNTVDLNCKAPAVLINLILPYMKRGSKILNISSASSFQPVPYINLYASTKAFERSYSRALGAELKSLGITVTAVCPSWVDTEMIQKEINGHKVKFPGIVSANQVAKKAVSDAKKGKDMSVCSFYVKCQHIFVKIWPAKLSMKIWIHAVKKYI